MARNAHSGPPRTGRSAQSKTKASKAKASSKRESKRDHILGVSLRLFAKHGYESTTIRMIAQEAGMSLGLLYNYFDGKNRVLEEICRRNLEKLDAVYRIPDQGEPKARLEQLLDHVFHHAQKHPQFHKLFRGVRNQAAVQQLVGTSFSQFDRKVVQRLEGLMVDLARHRVEQAGARQRKQQGAASRVSSHSNTHAEANAQVDAHLLYASIDGICAQHVAKPKRFHLQSVHARLLERFTA